MRLLRSFFHWGLCPQAPGIYRFFSARMGMVLRGRLRATAAVAPMPFRPLNRSLGLLPSIALSRPAQVSSVSTEAVRYPIQKQRTVITLLIRCLTFGVQSNACTPRPPPSLSPPGRQPTWPPQRLGRRACLVTHPRAPGGTGPKATALLSSAPRRRPRSRAGRRATSRRLRSRPPNSPPRARGGRAGGSGTTVN
jgi:hypothetical protein